MKNSSKISPKIILSGGGTGGHIYPALAIANEIRSRFPQADILFVGAKDKMEMEKVPKAGYPIKGLWISGFQRQNMKANISFPFKLVSSLWNARKIVKQFKPDMVIGTGGFASGPLLYAASLQNIPILIQEQNSFPGITNKLLKNKAFAICTAYDKMGNYFPKDKIHPTGNPIRTELFQNLPDKKTAKEKFNLDPDKPVILSVGGSLGARTLNTAWTKGIDKLKAEDVQLIWQTGKLEWKKINAIEEVHDPLVQPTEFIYEMDQAYAAADVIVSRAGAMAISELTLVGKPTILVPLPTAAEDHQTKNAQNLVDKSASVMVKDSDAPELLVTTAIDLIKDDNKRNELSKHLKEQGKPNATKDIVDIIDGKLEELNK